MLTSQTVGRRQRHIEDNRKPLPTGDHIFNHMVAILSQTTPAAVFQLPNFVSVWYCEEVVKPLVVGPSGMS